MKQQSKNRIGIHYRGGRFILRGYDTDEDLKHAKADIERFLTVLSQDSVYNIMRFLAPYREKAGKSMQIEYEEMKGEEW